MGNGVRLKDKVTMRTDINHFGMDSEIHCLLRQPTAAYAFKSPLIGWEMTRNECGACTLDSLGAKSLLV